MSGSKGSEDIEASLWITNRLTSDTHLNTTLGLNGRVYEGRAPTDTMFPYVVHNMQSAQDVYSLGAVDDRLAVDMVWTIQVVTGAADMALAKPVIDEVQRVMQAPVDTITRTLSDGSVWSTVFTCRRDRPVSYSESHSGQIVWHRGATYRLTVQSFMVTPPTGP